MPRTTGIERDRLRINEGAEDGYATLLSFSQVPDTVRIGAAQIVST